MPIEWMDSGGAKTRGRFVGGRFVGVWMMDCGMYVYYTPTRWRYAA